MNLIIIGLILDIIGVFVLTLVAIINPHYTKIHNENWRKKYWWMSWMPFFKISHPSGKVERKIKWNRKVIVYGFIPFNHKLNIFGFLCILVGFILQLKFYL